MQSTMDLKQHHACVQRAIALGRGRRPGAFRAGLTPLRFARARPRRSAAESAGEDCP